MCVFLVVAGKRSSDRLKITCLGTVKCISNDALDSKERILTQLPCYLRSKISTQGGTLTKFHFSSNHTLFTKIATMALVGSSDLVGERNQTNASHGHDEMKRLQELASYQYRSIGWRQCFECMLAERGTRKHHDVPSRNGPQQRLVAANTLNQL